MNLEFHLNAVQIKWPDAQQLAELRGTGWRLPTRAEVVKHAAAILAINEDLAAKCVPYVWTSEPGLCAGASMEHNGEPVALDAWLVDLNTGRERLKMKSARAHVVLVRNMGGKA